MEARLTDNIHQLIDNKYNEQEHIMHTTTIKTECDREITHRFQVGDTIHGQYDHQRRDRSSHRTTTAIIAKVGVFPQDHPKFGETDLGQEARHGEPIYVYTDVDRCSWDFVKTVDEVGSFELVPKLKFKAGDRLVDHCNSSVRRTITAVHDGGNPYQMSNDQGDLGRFSQEYIEMYYVLAPPRQVEDLTREELEYIVNDIVACQRQGFLDYLESGPPKWSSLEPIKHLWA